jgi:hypothetical protein
MNRPTFAAQTEMPHPRGYHALYQSASTWNLQSLLQSLEEREIACEV